MADLKDLKNMTVRALRDLARSVIGPGYTRLRTRADLLEALRAALERGKGEPESERPDPTGNESAWRVGPGAPGLAREPRPEGHLVARMAGEGELAHAPHALTEDQLAAAKMEEAERPGEQPATPSPPAAPAPMPGPVDLEGLGELPAGYGDDALVALPRDPTTLWVYWDYAHHTVQEAMRGLVNPRARMRIFERGRLVREIEFALESRSYYIHDLEPGLHYRVELYFYGDDGRLQRIGRPSNTIGLPPKGPSPIIDDRFVTLPWGTPLGRRYDLFAVARPEEGWSGEDREALYGASRGRPIGASENLPPGGPEGGSVRAGPWSGSRYEGA